MSSTFGRSESATWVAAWAVIGAIACLLGSVTIFVEYGGGALFRAWLLAFSYSCFYRWAETKR